MKVKCITSKSSYQRFIQETNMEIEIGFSPTPHSTKRRMESSTSHMKPVTPASNLLLLSLDIKTPKPPSLQPQPTTPQHGADDRKQFISCGNQTNIQTPCSRCENKNQYGATSFISTTCTAHKTPVGNWRTEDDRPTSSPVMTPEPLCLCMDGGYLEMRIKCDKDNPVHISRYPLPLVENTDPDATNLGSRDAVSLSLHPQPDLVTTRQFTPEAEKKKLLDQDDDSHNFPVCHRCREKDQTGPASLPSIPARNLKTEKICHCNPPVSTFTKHCLLHTRKEPTPPPPLRQSRTLSTDIPVHRRNHPPWK